MMRNIGMGLAVLLAVGPMTVAPAEARAAAPVAPAVVTSADVSTDGSDPDDTTVQDPSDGTDGADDTSDAGTDETDTDPSDWGQSTDDPTDPVPDAAPSPGSVRFGPVWVDGNGSSSRAVVGNRSTLPITFYAYVQSSSVKDPAPHLALQRRVGGGRWTTLSARVPAPSDTGAVIVRTPAYSTPKRTAAVAYRLRSSAYADAVTGGIGTTATSSAFTIVYDNQGAYTGMARTIWNLAKPYCPTTAVRIAKLQPGRAGQYQTGGLLIEVDPGVGSRFNTTSTYQQSLALHECAHERQWLNYGSTSAGRSQMERSAARLFTNDRKPASVRVPYLYFPTVRRGFDPIEHAADCSAQALHPGGYLGYGGYCNAKELREGRRLLLGKRY